MSSAAAHEDPQDLDPSEFVLRIRELTQKKDEEDAERYRQLEEEIIKGRSEREARRAERARSISPEKSSAPSTPRSLRNSTMATPSSPRDQALEALDGAAAGSDLDKAPSSGRRGSGSPAASQMASPNASRPLSWQRRPNSSDRRPLSMVAAENAARSPRATPESAPETEAPASRTSIAQSLSKKDPAWFRQTPDRGIGSAAYRRGEDDSGSESGSASGKRRLPGMSTGAGSQRPSSGHDDSVADAKNRQSLAESMSPPPDDSRSSSPSRASSFRDSSGWSNRLSASTAQSGTSTIGARSPIPQLESQRLKPPGSAEAGTAEEGAGTPRGPAMSPSQGRISPERPASPTKGMGGFVQSAMLKRSDSVNKRWSAQASPNHSRQNSTASLQSGFGSLKEHGLPPSSSTPKFESSHSRGSSLEPGSRPSSSHSNLTVTQANSEGRNETSNDGFVKPALPRHDRSKSVASPGTTNTSVEDDTEGSLPRSPSKRWSPTKSSWLESALSRPESPTKSKGPSSDQPSWMTELSRARHQRQQSTPSPVKESPSTDFGSIRNSLRRAGSRDIDSPIAEIAKPSKMENEGGVGSMAKSPEPDQTIGSPAPSVSHGSTVVAVASIDKSAAEDKPSAAASSPVNSPKGASTTIATKPKPDTPPKKDFRSGLKSRQNSEDTKSSNEPEFKNIFGKLKKTQTQNYVAPDELKNNIMRGKAGLNITGGPQKTVRRDEFKESIIEKKRAFQEKPDFLSLGAKPFEAKKSDKPAVSAVPEALARRQNMATREKTPEDKPVEAPKFNKPSSSSVPEAIARRQNLSRSGSDSKPSSTGLGKAETSPKELRKQNSKPEDEPAPSKPTTTKPSGFGAKAPAMSGKLADRFNPALANMLARGPPGAGGAGGRSSPSQPASSTPSNSADAPANSAELTHMTKGRARGPKRRAPAAKAEEPRMSPSSEPAPVNPEDVPEPVALVKSTNIVPSSEPVEKVQSPPPSPEASRKPDVKPKPAPSDPSKADTPSAKPLGALLMAETKAKTSLPAQPSEPLKKPLDASSGKTKESIVVDSATAGATTDSSAPQKALASGFSQSPRNTAAVGGPRPLSMTRSRSPTKSRFESTEAPMETRSPIKSRFEADEALKEPRSPTKEVSKEEVVKPSTSVRNSATMWGQQNAAERPVRSRSPIKLPTHKDEKAAMESAGLVKRDRSPEKPVGLGLGLPGTPGPQILKSPPASDPPSTKKYPMSPPLSAGLRSKPETQPEPRQSPTKPTNELVNERTRFPSTTSEKRLSSTSSSKAPPESPIPDTSAAGRLLADFFGETPSTKVDVDVDAHAILSSKPFAEGKIKTLRKNVQEVTGDLKLSAVSEDHVLYDDAIILCTHTFNVPTSGQRNTEVYLWAGDAVPESAIEDAQLVARRVAKENGGKLLNFRQGKETPNFLEALGGIVVTRRGPRQRLTNQKTMLCGRRHLGHIAFDEVDFSVKSLHSAYPYLVADSGKVFLWKGTGCSAEELGCARLIGMDLGSTPEIIEVDESQEPTAFVDLFPAGERSIPRSANHWRLKPSSDKFAVRLFRVEQQQQQGGLQVSSIWSSIVNRRPSSSWSGQAQQNNQSPQSSQQANQPSMNRQSQQSLSAIQSRVVEISPFTQSDLEPEFIHVLDAFFDVYVVVGALSQSQSHAFSTALLFAQDYAMEAASLEDRPFLPVSTVVLEGVPRDMKFVFRQWEDKQIPTSALMAGKPKRQGSLRIVKLAAALAATSG